MVGTHTMAVMVTWTCESKNGITTQQIGGWWILTFLSPHLQRQKELWGNDGSTSDSDGWRAISSLMGCGNFVATGRNLTIFLMATALDGLVEVFGAGSWPRGDGWEAMMGSRQRKFHGQRLFMICDGRCYRDFFLVLLACPWYGNDVVPWPPIK